MQPKLEGVEIEASFAHDHDFAVEHDRARQHRWQPLFQFGEVPRKRLQVANAPRKSATAKLIKIADKTSNLRSILLSPPVDWDARRRREYFEWAAQVVAGCRGVNDRIEAAFDAAYKAGVR